ncbi:MAG: NACHT domain-containing protein [Oleispira antarctica]|nr:NACHT domain-containing protein [Oleispira antarctica]MBQ0794123.1 NACHT domain-containing protein [Oleispira antarctica]
MSENIKRSAIPAAGYVYQNRHGLKVICEWLDAPSRYRRVKFECDIESEAPQGLDDLVIERRDGRFDLYQVKFTVNSDKYLLDWNWLFEKSSNGKKARSTIKKWFDAFQKLDPDNIGVISLITNRRPDPDMEACLINGKISVAKIPKIKRLELIKELGSIEKCEEFFNHLFIQHSDKSYVSLEHDVDAALKKHGSLEGVERLKNLAMDWAIRKKSPDPDGWIHLELVQTILRALPPEPLPEDFALPAGYNVPDISFHDEFLQEVSCSDGKVVVLTGPPGRGKSTYLSNVFHTLKKKGIPAVRHHYYLSTTERGRDRIHSYVVEESILAQVERYHQDVPSQSGLRRTIESCSAYYKEQGVPFVLILDGLDHVWRTNSSDKRPLEDIFSQLLPCPENMVLLVGTQPVDDEQLPADLLAYASRVDWRTLPPMSENAVLTYLRKAIGEGRLANAPQAEQFMEEQLREAASALHTKTAGHPLHVIYSIAELEISGRILSAWEVGQLAGDMTQGVQNYYASLWVRLPPSLQDSLRLVCEFPFFWPEAAFSEITNQLGAAKPDISSVKHLMHTSGAGLRIFHESLAVFVRRTDGYKARIQVLTPAVAKWLETDAPQSLRVNWLWTVQARLGKPENLIRGMTRDWIMKRLEEGYPKTLFDTLLSEGLEQALNTYKFSDAYRISHLRDRLVYGMEFQVEGSDFARLISNTLSLTTDESVIQEFIASRHEIDILHLCALGLALKSRGDQGWAQTCGEEALNRFRGMLKFTNRYSSGSGIEEFKFIISAFAQLGAIGSTLESLHSLIFDNDVPTWLPCLHVLVNEGELDNLMAVIPQLDILEKKKVISDTCIRAAVVSGVIITDRDDFSVLEKTPFVASFEAVLTRTSESLHEPIPINWRLGGYSEEKEALAALIHHWFFSTVHHCLHSLADGCNSFEYIPAPMYSDRENITEFLNALADTAQVIAKRWWNGEFVDFHELFELFEPVKLQQFSQNYLQASAAEDFRRSLILIACDVHLISTSMKGSDCASLSKETISSSLKWKWFDRDFFLKQYSLGVITKMSDEAAELFIEQQHSLYEKDVKEETSILLQTPFQLFSIALAHSLFPKARRFCNQTWELVTGYGHRKDPTLGNTIAAISYLADAAPLDACRLLGLVAPQVHNVLSYTDGKGTRYVVSVVDQLLAKLKPSALVTKYEEHIHLGEWSFAENCLSAYLEQGSREGWPLSSILRTGVHSEAYDYFLKPVDNQAMESENAAEILRQHNGLDIGFIENQEQSGGTDDGEPYEDSFTTYEPGQLDEFYSSLSKVGYRNRKQLLRDWYIYWESQKEGGKLIEVLDKKFFSKGDWSDIGSDVLHLSDLLFQTKRKRSGKEGALKYLIHAQIAKGGWVGYMESPDEICIRLDLVAKYYPELCDKFVRDTTYNMLAGPERQRSSPSELIVYLFIKQGRIDTAIDFVESMVCCVIEDTRTLPLKVPKWAKELKQLQKVVAE